MFLRHHPQTWPNDQTNVHIANTFLLSGQNFIYAPKIYQMHHIFYYKVQIEYQDHQGNIS